MEVAMQSQKPKPSQRRSHRSSDQWRKLLLCFEESNLLIKDFCIQENLSLATFQRWRNRLNKTDAPSGFMELQPPDPTPTLSGLQPWSLELDLPGGGRLRIRSGL
jgi:hypothetical protein